MTDYLYDGSFEGLLSCIYENYYGEKATGIFLEKNYQANLMAGFSVVKTDETKATKVYDAIEGKISLYDLRRLYRVFLSNVPQKENKILAYVKMGFKEGGKIALLHSHPVVLSIQEADKKVSFEIHRLAGLVRFSVMRFDKHCHGEEDLKRTTDNLKKTEILYSTINPDHDVTELLAPHFTTRFFNDPFIIHDESRGKALVASQGHWEVVKFTGKELLKETEEEEGYRVLWKQYFETIAIKERINPNCQKRCMPTRYWRNLTELNKF